MRIMDSQLGYLIHANPRQVFLISLIYANLDLWPTYLNGI